MKWLKFRIETTEEAEDILISDLYDCGLARLNEPFSMLTQAALERT